MVEKKQRVLIVHNYYQIPGGEDMVVENEEKLLKEHGHEVFLYTRTNEELKHYSKWQKLLLPFSTVFNGKTYHEVKRIIKEKKIEIVHVHNTLNIVSPSVYYAAFHCNVPVVQTVHNFRFLCPGATFYRDGNVCEECLKKGLLCAVKYKCYRGSRVQTLGCVMSMGIQRLLRTYKKLNYICLTEFNKQKLMNLKQIQEKQIFVKPNFSNSEKNIIPYTERKKQFAYIGRLDQLKGLDVLLRAWNQLNDYGVKLIICGTGPLEEWCREYARKNHMDMVEFKGFVINSDARKIMEESLAVILPTQWYEGFPMTIAESFSCGTYVIGSELGNTGSLIEEGVSGWKFSHRSQKELMACVKKAIEWKQDFPEEIRRKYSAEENYRTLYEIYQSCKPK